MSTHISNVRPEPDQVLAQIADYVLGYDITSPEAYETARYCLVDTIGCGLEALSYPACTKLLGPIVPGTVVPNGAKVPGTQFQLDPVQAAFNIGAMIRWLDFNDTWLAAEWGHPSDNLGGILATADWLSRNAIAAGKTPLTVRDVLTAMIKAHEIQGVLALENAFNRVGLDHVVLVKVASTAVVGGLPGLTHEEIVNALSLAWVDGQALRTYRHAPNSGSRKSWAAGDATSRAVRLAMITLAGEMGIPGVLTAPQWGFYDVLFSKTNKDQQLKPEAQRRFSLPQAYGLQVCFTDGTKTDRVEIEYPVGHRRRRIEGIPLLEQKFLTNLRTRFPECRCEQILACCLDKTRLDATSVAEFMELLVIN